MVNIDRKTLNNYWKYYLMLENRLINTFQYVELNEKNYNTFSNEFSLLITAAGNELDIIFKILCNYDLDDNKNIKFYSKVIYDNYPQLLNDEVSINETNIVIKPFENLDINSSKKSLFWWAIYDNLKHNRFSHIDEANLKNVLYILSGLFLLEMKLFKEISDIDSFKDIPDIESKLFSLKKWDFRCTNMSNIYAVRVE